MVSVLVIAATETELNAFYPSEFMCGCVNLRSAVLGVGNVASLKLHQLLLRYKFDFVLLVGSCGSNELTSGTIVAPSCILDSGGCTRIDLECKDCRFSSIEKQYVSLFPQSTLIEVSQFTPEFSCPATCNVEGKLVYDMETYSIADVCKSQGVSFAVLKIVVDGCENEISSISEYLQFEKALYNEKTTALKTILRDSVMSVRDFL